MLKNDNMRQYFEDVRLEIDFIDRKATKCFVALQVYESMLLLMNFSFKTTIFRHSFPFYFRILMYLY